MSSEIKAEVKQTLALFVERLSESKFSADDIAELFSEVLSEAKLSGLSASNEEDTELFFSLPMTKVFRELVSRLTKDPRFLVNLDESRAITIEEAQVLIAEIDGDVKPDAVIDAMAKLNVFSMHPDGMIALNRDNLYKIHGKSRSSRMLARLAVIQDILASSITNKVEEPLSIAYSIIERFDGSHKDAFLKDIRKKAIDFIEPIDDWLEIRSGDGSEKSSKAFVYVLGGTSNDR